MKKENQFKEEGLMPRVSIPMHQHGEDGSEQEENKKNVWTHCGLSVSLCGHLQVQDSIHSYCSVNHRLLSFKCLLFMM